MATWFSDALGGEEAPSLDMATIINEYGLGEVDLLKVDIEGGELAVFEASDAWIDQVAAIAIELHDRMLPRCSRVFFDATVDFEEQWQRGETTFVCRRAMLHRFR